MKQKKLGNIDFRTLQIRKLSKINVALNFPKADSES